MATDVTVNDLMQKGYRYQRVVPAGDHFHPDFRPALSPPELLSMGIFGGKYMTDCRDEFPAEWFEKAKLSPQRKDITLNYYKVDASLPLREWRKRGWIYAEDPRGWFQWYCRYYMGRRIPGEDERQIKRWKGIKRHAAAIRKNCRPGDATCRPKQRQTLLHWAYDSRRL